MSFVRSEQGNKCKGSKFQFQMLPHPGVRSNDLKHQAQQEVIDKMHKEGANFFNNATVSLKNNVYTANIPRGIPVADMLQPMQEYDLVMKANLSIDPENNTCAMITADDLQNGEINTRDGTFSLGFANGHIRSVSFNNTE